jgi:ribosomal protein S18 acetylase RimI-like enzyme
MTKVMIRRVQLKDLDRVAEIESICFPETEAASHKAFEERIKAFPECFLIAEEYGLIIGFINGCVTNSSVIYDELFISTDGHLPNGNNIAIFGLDVIPEYRRKGIAAQLMDQFIVLAKNTRRKSIILTCKYGLVHYYESFGYVNKNVSKSTHGGAEWFDMTLVL